MSDIATGRLDTTEALRLLELASGSNDLAMSIENDKTPVEGESTRVYSDGKQRLDVMGYALHTARRNVATAVGAGGVTSTLTIVRRSDAATATLASLLSSNNDRLKLTLSVYRAGGAASKDTDPMIQYLYEGARIAEMLLLTGGATGAPCEVIRFSFRQLTIESAPQTGTGARGAVRTSTFSMAD
ncbi:type VI secretion system tube protein Hcp [Variovorax sp. PAMC 28711]|uniref:type VI secretion system tube protein Hcp n=1 Tax=Variovorax sp. PAMC 28711 TaxID=1795631 RepID=UPI00078CB42F|nr:type VI secretion system tube protein Hcp [Variovorax sp. PAMC 28711]AMM25101.1 hypothetical protein AX767_12550 [Variovorax sp. PAMC 28711]